MVTTFRSEAGAALCAASLVALLSWGACATSASKRATEQELRRAQSHFELGVDHLQNGRTALALRELLSAERLDPRNPDFQYALARAYLRKARVEESLAHLERAIEIYPDHHEARLLRSNLYMHLKRYPDAIAETELLLDDPTFPAPWRALANRGWANFRLGRREDARRDLQLAREYNDQYWPTLLNLGILESEEGHQLEAIALFDEVLALRSRPAAKAEANYRLAEIYVSLGKRARAVEHLMAAVAQAPDDEWGKKSEEYLKLLR